MACIEDFNYEILAKHCSFEEARSIIISNCTEIYEVPPGFKLVGKCVLGNPPIIVGIKDEKLVFSYTKPCYGTFVVIVEDPVGINAVRNTGKKI
ncbi:MAG TPA: DUF1894 domain-containing protein [Methanocorpusculum sp.]|nr:DUF1894 domain-containing protein [Methanocorpusculum sp.]